MWKPSTVESILTNEKYKGAALLQKSFTVDFLTKKMKVNEGEVPQYYIEDSHEAIIDQGAKDSEQPIAETQSLPPVLFAVIVEVTTVLKRGTQTANTVEPSTDALTNTQTKSKNAELPTLPKRISRKHSLRFSTFSLPIRTRLSMLAE